MRKWLLLLLILTVTAPIVAQETPEANAGRGWRAWLFNANSGLVTVVDQQGAVVNEFTLPLSQAFNYYGQNIAVSPSGSHILYTAIDTSADIANQQVFVYDVNAQFIAATYPLELGAQATTLDVRVDSALFDEATRHVAFGYVITSETMVGWEVVVLDYNTGIEETVLTAESAPASIIPADGLIVPVIRAFDGVNVTFTAVFYATGGAAMYPSYVWDTTSNTLMPTEIFTSIGADVLPETREVIAPTFMESMSTAALPAEPGFTVQQNVVTVYQPQTATRHVFYNDADKVIDNVRFVQDGERIAISRYDAVTDTPGLWRVIERDGTIVGETQISNSVFNVFGTPDGMVYLDLAEGPALVHINTRDDSLSQEVIWTGEMQTFPVLVAVQPDVIVAAQEAVAYGDWVQLTDPEPIE
ncbi:MAG: hypothetical protein RLP44_13290 [Aggregatilineales bacterium]